MPGVPAIYRWPNAAYSPGREKPQPQLRPVNGLRAVKSVPQAVLFSPNGAGSAEAAEASILAGVDKILSTCARLVIVTGEVFSGGNQYAGDTDTYLRLLARVNRALAARADEVCEVVCGLPVWYKSENEVFV